MREVKAVLQPLWKVQQSSCWSWIFRRTQHKWQLQGAQFGIQTEGTPRVLLSLLPQWQQSSCHHRQGWLGMGWGWVTPLSPGVLSGTEWDLKLSVQGEHLGAAVSAGHFGCKHPAQRRMSGAPSGRNFPCAQALPELSKRISLAAYKYRRTFLQWHHCCVLWCTPDHRKIVTGGV